MPLLREVARCLEKRDQFAELAQREPCGLHGGDQTQAFRCRLGEDAPAVLSALRGEQPLRLVKTDGCGRDSGAPCQLADEHLDFKCT